MADFFKSAFGYLGNSGVSQDNDFVGQYVELGDQKLRVKRVIAEGKEVSKQCGQYSLVIPILRSYLLAYITFVCEEGHSVHHCSPNSLYGHPNLKNNSACSLCY